MDHRVKEKEPAVPSVGGTETVMLVASGEVRDELAASLGMGGYRVMGAASPATAWTMAERHDGPIELLIVELIPGIVLWDLAVRFRRRYPGQRLLCITDAAPGSPERQAAPPGAAFLPRAFTAESLAHAVRDILDL
jgi:hypothetical protein